MDSCDHQLVSEVIRSIATQRRRVILDYLLTAEAGQVTFDALVDHVVEADTHSPSPDRQAVAATLYHRHLPTLAAEGLIEYERDHGLITTTHRTELAEPYLASVRRVASQPEVHE